MSEQTQCPNCRTNLPGGASYCAKCGYGTKDGKPQRVPFPWVVVVVLMLIVPLGTFGACLVWLTADGRNYGDIMWLSIPLNIEFYSIAVGIVMILVNLMTLVIQGKK
ncbi:MAG: zinc ribbon domain-containing protein [Armatimonadota bacterium]